MNKKIYIVRNYNYDDNMADVRAFENKADAVKYADDCIKERLKEYHVSNEDLQEMIKDWTIEREQGGDFERESTARVQIYELELWGAATTIYS